MVYQGVIFDFNGTLFWDTKLHNKAWDVFLERYDIKLDDQSKFRKIHGKNNKDILFGIFGEGFSDDKLARLALEKETLYQQLCLQTHMAMAPGAEAFLDFLKQRGIPFTIATASGKENLDFYFEHLPLTDWFDYDKVVYNDGTIKGKPDPEIYHKAMTAIGVDAGDVLVFEDANMGLLAAKNAGAGGIVVVNSNDDDYTDWRDYQIITNFEDVDRSLFPQ